MSDASLNYYLARGTAAARAAFTPNPATPAAGPAQGYVWYETDTGDTYAWDGSAWDQVNTGGGGGGGGTVTSTGAVGSEPGSPASGDLYLPTNGFHVERYDGTAWRAWGPISPMTPPVAGAFTWVNQGSAVTDATHGGIYLEGQASGTLAMHVLKKAAPATPYTVTAALIIVGSTTAGAAAGLVWRESSSGKIVCVDWETSAGKFSMEKFNTATSYSGGGYSPTGSYRPMGPVVWLQLADTGTDRIASVSMDGYHFIPIHTVGRTDFCIADEVGIGVRDQNAAYAGALTLLSWKEA